MGAEQKKNNKNGVRYMSDAFLFVGDGDFRRPEFQGELLRISEYIFFFLSLFSALEVPLYIYRAEEKAFCIPFSAARLDNGRRPKGIKSLPSGNSPARGNVGSPTKGCRLRQGKGGPS